VAPVLLGPSPERMLEEVINPLGDAACNMHLAVFIVDALLLSIFPEMGVEGSGGNADLEILERLDDDGGDWGPEMVVNRTTSAMAP
jgi:hypothetical protein